MLHDMYAANSLYHQRRRWIRPATVRCLESALALLGTPGSLLDVGCGEGALVQWAQEQRIDAMGVDLAAPDRPGFVRADLQQPLDMGRVFEWVLCWEVAEHLPESAADTLCQTIIRHVAPLGRVLFTAARPGQRGPGHCNCQPPAYWEKKFAAHRFLPVARTTTALAEMWKETAPLTPWYGRNVMVFERPTT